MGLVMKTTCRSRPALDSNSNMAAAARRSPTVWRVYGGRERMSVTRILRITSLRLYEKMAMLLGVTARQSWQEVVC